MIVTESILIIWSVYILVLTRSRRGMKKEMNKMHSVHIFNVYSTVGYRFGRNSSRLDTTAVIAYDSS